MNVDVGVIAGLATRILGLSNSVLMRKRDHQATFDYLI